MGVQPGIGPQEQLFLTTPDSVFIERSFDQVERVNIIERAIHLRNSIDLLAQVNMRIGFLQSPNAQATYGANADQVTQGAREKITGFRKAAKFEFGRAFGLFLLDDQPDDVQAEARASALESFAHFYQGYDEDPDTARSPKVLREHLDQNIRLMVSTDNRDNSLRPHKFEPIAASEENGMTSREKLTAIQEDPRAGFLPTTHREKNAIMSYLDYLDNPSFKLGPRNQILEVVLFQHKHKKGEAGYERGRRAAVSIAHEFGDFYTQSNQQLAQLQRAAEIIGGEVNPKADLQLTFLDEIALIKPLIRYMDLKEFRTAGKVSYNYEGKTYQPRLMPMGTQRNESFTDQKTGKNKSLEDRYTSEEPHEEMTKWFMKRVSQLKVVDLRKEVLLAITDQQRRVHFHRNILQELDQPKATVELGLAQEIAHRYLADQVA